MRAWLRSLRRALARWLAPTVIDPGPEPDVHASGRFQVHVTYGDGSTACVYRGEMGAKARTYVESHASFPDRGVVFTDGTTIRTTLAPRGEATRVRRS